MRDDERHRRAAGDREAQPAAEGGAHLARHQPIERRPDQPLDRRRPAPRPLRLLKPAPADALGERAQPARQGAALGQPFVDGEIGALVNARHRDQDRRPDVAHVLDQMRHRTGVGDRRADGDRQVIAGGALEGVRQRQERKKEIAGNRRNAMARRHHIGDDGAVRQHYALRPASRAGRVDDRRQGVWRDWPFGRRFPFRCGEPVSGADDARVVADRFVGPGKHDDPLQFGAIGEFGREAAPIVGAVEDHHGRAAVANDEADVAGIVGDVQRRDRQTEGQRRLVDTDIVDAVDHQGRHAGARLQPLGGKGGAPAGAFRRHPPPAPIEPAASGGIAPAIGDGVRTQRRAGAEKL